MATRTKNGAGVSFGRNLSYTSIRKLKYTVTDDDKAFEIRFETAIAAGVGSPSFAGLEKTKAPIGTRVFSAVIPATGKNVKATVTLNGFFIAHAGTSVLVFVTANDQQVVKQFRKSQDDKGFTVSVPVHAKSLSEIRLAVALLAQQEGGAADASALIAVSDIGCDTFVPKKRSPPK
jgi:hypothetical protein